MASPKQPYHVGLPDILHGSSSLSPFACWGIPKAAHLDHAHVIGAISCSLTRAIAINAYQSHALTKQQGLGSSSESTQTCCGHIIEVRDPNCEKMCPSVDTCCHPPMPSVTALHLICTSLVTAAFCMGDTLKAGQAGIFSCVANSARHARDSSGQSSAWRNAAQCPRHITTQHGRGSMAEAAWHNAARHRAAALTCSTPRCGSSCTVG